MNARLDSITRMTPRKRPQQARSRQMQADIVAAAAELLRARGLDGFTTNAVAERAGVSIGSVYQYFPAKEAILAVLIREMRRDMRDDLVQAADRAAGRSLCDAVQDLIEASLRHHQRDPALSLVCEHIEDNLPMDAETDALKRDMAVIVTRVLDEHRMHAPGLAAGDIIAMCHGMVQAALRSGETDLTDLSLRMKRAAMGYLGSPEPAEDRHDCARLAQS